MSLDLHGVLASCPTRAVLILGKQLNIKINLIDVDYASGAHLTPEFEQLNPRKVIPVLIDDGFVIAESRVILTYLINQYFPDHNLYPADAKKRAQIDRVLYLTAEMFEREKAVVREVFFEGKWPIPGEPLEKYFELLKALEILTTDKKFLAGDEMSIADISFICDITMLTNVLGADIAPVAPGVAGWIERIKGELPEYEELVEKVLEGFKEGMEEKLGHKLE